MSGKIKKSVCDADGHEIYREDSDGYVQRWKYDAAGNMVYHDTSSGLYERWKYDAAGREVHYKSNNFERLHKYDDAGNEVYYKDVAPEELDGTCEVWKEYDTAGNMIHSRSSGGVERWCKYDASRNMVYEKEIRSRDAGAKPYGLESRYEYDAVGKLVHSKIVRLDSSLVFEKRWDSAGNLICHKMSDDGVFIRDVLSEEKAESKSVTEKELEVDDDGWDR